MAPEMIQDNSYSFPADIWSLGCVIYELMTLKPPFIGSKIPDLTPKITKGEYPPLEGNYNQKLKDLIENMLTVNIDKRITIEEILKMNFLPNISIDQNTEILLSGKEFNSLGLKYKKGDGVDINLQEAMKYFKMSADLGIPEGICNYGISLAEGYSGQKDVKEAMKYFKLSADLGNSNGMLNYGIGLEEGYLGSKDLQEAKKYYKMSADLGNSEAEALLNRHISQCCFLL
jgi:serine/threonine protein kinase